MKQVVILVAGEPGTGKTRLLNVIKLRLEADGFEVKLLNEQEKFPFSHYTISEHSLLVNTEPLTR
jgi:thymidylate kinase